MLYSNLRKDIMKINFNELEGAELIIDCIYEGGNQKNLADDPLSKYFQNVVIWADLEKYTVMMIEVNQPM